MAYPEKRMQYPSQNIEEAFEEEFKIKKIKAIVNKVLALLMILNGGEKIFPLLTPSSLQSTVIFWSL